MSRIVFSVFLIIVLTNSALAQEVTKSSNFIIETPSISNGSSSTSSNNYTARGTIGDTFSGELESSNYSLSAGEASARQADVLPKPTWQNDDDWVDRLLIKIDPQQNSTDTKYAIAVSKDDFQTAWFVQSDLTIGTTLGSEDWLTYADLGESSGKHVIGLTENTTYKVKVAANSGSFSETRYSAISDPATTSQSYLRLASSSDNCVLGELTTDQTKSCQYDLTLNTNLSLGAKITVLGKTLTQGGNTINPIGAIATTSKKGQEQFGLAATSETVTTLNPFNNANEYAFAANVEQNMATAASKVNNGVVKVNWVANISRDTVPGRYQTAITHTAYAN